MTAIFHLLKGWLLWLLSALGLISRPRFVGRVSEHHPSVDELTERDLVIVQSGPHLKWACFICPCGCGDKIALSLAPERRPRWTVTLDGRCRPTVYPSVWQHAGCYSHFWIRAGDVEWCRGTGQPPSAGLDGFVA
jgi:hypothetical protein